MTRKVEHNHGAMVGGSRYHPISAAAHHTVIPVKV